MPYGQPAFTEPGEMPGKDEITVEWDETSRCKATIKLDLARELFGLGGTPDNAMLETIALLAANFPTSLLAKLGPHVAYDRPHTWKLWTLDGIRPGDL